MRLPVKPRTVRPLLPVTALQARIAVSETGNMSRAAKRLDVTQSAVSQAIQRLEEPVGAAVFDRARRPLRTTTAGQILVKRAEAIVREIEALPGSVSTRHLPGLRLAMPDSLADTVGPALVREASAIAQNLYVTQGLSPQHAELLVERQVDIIIAANPFDHLDGLARYPLLIEPYVMLVPSGFARLAQRSALSELQRRLPLIRYSGRSTVGKTVDRYLRRIGANSTRRLEADNAALVGELVGGGAGWAIATPMHLLQGKAHLAGVEVLPLPPPIPTREITLLTHLGDLEVIASRLAQITRGVLRDVCLPEFLRLAPWLKDQLQIV